MRTRKNRWILSTAVLAGATLCALMAWTTLTTPRPDQHDAAQSPPLELSLQSAQQVVYDVSVDSRLQIEDSASSKEWAHRLSGRLSIQSAAASNDNDGAAARFACVLRAPLQEVDGAACPDPLLESPFTVDVDAAGRFTAFHFPANLPEAPRGQLEELLRLFQVVVPATAGDSWRVEEPGRNGLCEVIYRRTGEGLSRCRLRYRPTAERRVAVHASNACFELADQGPWLRNGTVHEAITVRGTTTQTVHATTDGTLRLLSCESVAPISVASQGERLASANRNILELRSQERRADESQGTPATAADRSRFRALLAALDAADKPGAMLDQLRDAMLAHPDLCELLRDSLASGAHEDLTASTAIHALCMAGSAAAQETLLRLASDERMSQRNRVRALIDAGGVEVPTDATREMLWTLSSDLGSAASRELATTATLALGRLGGTMRRAGDAAYAPLRDRLLTELDGTRDDGQRVALLTAAGNTGDVSLREPVAQRMSDVEATTRAAAAKALGRIPNSRGHLLRGLVAEKNARVRGQIAGGLLRQGELGEAPLRIVARQLASETDESARFAMARLLGRDAGFNEVSRSALNDLMRTESSARIRRYVAGRLAGM